MLLKARPLPDTVGVRPIAITDSLPEAELPDPTILDLGGALQPLRPAPDRWPTPAARQRFRTALAGLLNLVDTVPADRPLLAPPRYGSVQTGRTALDPGPDDDWYAQLNLDPAGRIAAAYGTRVVQDQQELLMAAAWEQAAALRQVNDLLRHAAFGQAVASSLHRRFVSSMSPDAGLQVLGPAQARLSRTAAALRPEVGLVARAAATGLPRTAYAMAVRRATRPQGAVGRRIRRAPVLPGQPPIKRTGVLKNLQPVTFRGRLVVFPPAEDAGLATVERVAGRLNPPRFDLSWPVGTGDRVANAPPRPGFEVVDFGWPRPGPRPVPARSARSARCEPLTPVVRDPGLLPGAARVRSIRCARVTPSIRSTRTPSTRTRSTRIPSTRSTRIRSRDGTTPPPRPSAPPPARTWTPSCRSGPSPVAPRWAPAPWSTSSRRRSCAPGPPRRTPSRSSC